MVFGPLATLLAAWLTSRARQVLAPQPPVILNALIVGAVLAYTDTQGGAAFWPIFRSTPRRSARGGGRVLRPRASASERIGAFRF